MEAEQLLAGTKTDDFALIQDPDIEKATRSALRSPFFWTPLILSVVLTIGLNFLLINWSNGEISLVAVIVSIILVATALALFFGIRNHYIKKEKRELANTTEKARGILFSARDKFIFRVEGELWQDISRLELAAGNLEGEVPIVNSSIKESIAALKTLVIKFATVRAINGVISNQEELTVSGIIVAALKERRDQIASKNIKIKSKMPKRVRSFRQDAKLLEHLFVGSLDNVFRDSGFGDTIDLQTKVNRRSIAVAISEDAPVPEREFRPIFTAGDMVADVDANHLELYLNKMIAEHLGGQLQRAKSGNALRVVFRG